MSPFWMEWMQQLYAVRSVHRNQMSHGLITVGFEFLALLKCRRKPNLLFNGSDSTPVELSRRVQLIEQGDLLISNVRESDAGWYSCIRSNEAGSVIGQAYLGVMGMYFLKSSF